tara:strand:+ start:164 stop:403 length:240 start_codon:yes stop_codon:yes gene_type:complete
MTDLETIEFTLPIYWACYLINGDASGLNDGEQEEIDAFTEKEREGKAISWADVSEPWFAHSNDANGLGGDVATFTAILH